MGANPLLAPVLCGDDVGAVTVVCVIKLIALSLALKIWVPPLSFAGKLGIYLTPKQFPLCDILPAYL